MDEFDHQFKVPEIPPVKKKITNSNDRVVVYLLSAPGSGKSTIVRKFQEEVKDESNFCVEDEILNVNLDNIVRCHKESGDTPHLFFALQTPVHEALFQRKINFLHGDAKFAIFEYSEFSGIFFMKPALKKVVSYESKYEVDFYFNYYRKNFIEEMQFYFDEKNFENKFEFSVRHFFIFFKIRAEENFRRWQARQGEGINVWENYTLQDFIFWEFIQNKLLEIFPEFFILVDQDTVSANSLYQRLKSSSHKFTKENLHDISALIFDYFIIFIRRGSL